MDSIPHLSTPRGHNDLPSPADITSLSNTDLEGHTKRQARAFHLIQPPSGFEYSDTIGGLVQKLEHCEGGHFKIYEDYAIFYDSIYSDKDYYSEVRKLFRILATQGLTARPKVLDIGSGTGRHLEAMRAMKIEGTGIEPSESMVRQARRKGVPIHLGYLEEFEIDSPFDVCTAFFAVANHLPSDSLCNFFLAAQAKLREAGMFAIEIWAPSNLELMTTERLFTHHGSEYLRIVDPARTSHNSWVLTITIVASGSKDVVAREEHQIYRHGLEAVLHASAQSNMKVLHPSPIYLNSSDSFHQTYVFQDVG